MVFRLWAWHYVSRTLRKGSVETSHIAYAYSWFSAVLLARGGRGVAWTHSCIINGPVPGEDLEKESRAIIHICNIKSRT